MSKNVVKSRTSRTTTRKVKGKNGLRKILFGWVQGEQGKKKWRILSNTKG